jgi:hypothetical protein
MEERLRATLAEIRRIEGELRANGDVATLSRFGDPDRGSALAARFGYDTELGDDDARVVDQLSMMPDALQLVRDYLQNLFDDDQATPSSWSQSAHPRRSGSKPHGQTDSASPAHAHR